MLLPIWGLYTGATMMVTPTTLGSWPTIHRYNSDRWTDGILRGIFL